MKRIISISIVLAVLASCSTSNQVVSNKLFQKRKYQKGWHINNSKKLDKSTEVANTEEAVAHNQEGEKETPQAIVTDKKTEVNENTQSIESTSDMLLIVSDNEVVTSANLDLNTNQVNEAVTNTNNYENLTTNNVEEPQVISAESTTESSSSSGAEWYIWVLAFLIPPLAVGLVTDWDVKTVVINLLWCLLCGIPGIIHAFIIVDREG